MKSSRTTLFACLILLAVVAPAGAQRDVPVAVASNVLLDTDPAAAKILGAARDFLAARQWADAIDLLRQTADQHGERLVAIEPGRYINVQASVDILLSSLPPEGLKIYRAKVDPQVRRWFESAQKTRDVEGLERVIRKAFLSSYGDQSLLLLGDLAWEQGALARARGYWEKLLPPSVRPEPGEIPTILKYPDSKIAPEQIRMRLVLCQLYQGNSAKAQAELAAFRTAYPIATGRLAGREGKLANLLEGLVPSAQPPVTDPAFRATTSYAGNVERNLVQPRDFDVGAPRWTIRLPEVRVERSARTDELSVERSPPTMPLRVLSYFPVAWKNVAFYCTETDIHALELDAVRGGQPAWGNEASIYHQTREVERGRPLARGRAGLVRYTLSIDGDLLFARLGSTTAGAVHNRIGLQPGNSLVCLDLAREGDLIWTIKSDELDSDAGNWFFDGAPLAAEGRVYVALRRSDPQLQLNIACFDAASARLLWNRKVCNGVEVLKGDVDEVRHQLLTLAEERLYYATNLGTVAALDARDGSVSWMATYPRVEVETAPVFNKRQLQSPNPCVFHGGLLYAAPTDSESILAFDAETGVLKWSHEVRGKVPQLLGATQLRLIVAGDFLWALDAETGQVVWLDGQSDPEAATSGRGLLAGNHVYWPCREEIRIVEIATGRPVRNVELARRYGMYGGGNLAVAGGMLLVAQSDRLTAFSEFGGPTPPSRDALAKLYSVEPGLPPKPK